MQKDALRNSSAWRSGRSASVTVRARSSASFSSWRAASAAASVVVRGSWSKNPRIRSASKGRFWGSCHSRGPSLGPSASTPEAKKLARGASTSRSFFMWVMKRPPLTAKTKSSGVWSRHAAYDVGRCSE